MSRLDPVLCMTEVISHVCRAVYRSQPLTQVEPCYFEKMPSLHLFVNGRHIGKVVVLWEKRRRREGDFSVKVIASLLEVVAWRNVASTV